jgi:hypothetical protein
MNFVTLASRNTRRVVTMITSQTKVLSYHNWHFENEFIPFAVEIFGCLHKKVDDLFFQCVNMAWLTKGFRGLFLSILCSFYRQKMLWLFKISKSSNHRYFMMYNCNSKRNLLWVFHSSPYTTCFVLPVMGLGPRLFDFSF